MQTFTAEHPRFQEFMMRLEGPDACRFTTPGGEWRCFGDKTFARTILLDMGFTEKEVHEACEYFDDNHGYCDCEIIFNVGVE